ncbi:MAG: tetratricopeptide repeat protein [Deltaproteobacteria bacterium]|nr:tetratricopeptide repeat protein [Deltaproteobacteria bacterium]
MDQLDRKKISVRFFREAFEAQAHGHFDEAVFLYQKSVEAFPTPEALTFMGWSLSFLGKFEEAIKVCERAIQLDPSFGNPYNDIGAYLIELNKFDEAVPYLEKAIRAPRYDTQHFAHFNLARIWEKKGMIKKAMQTYQRAIEEDPEYVPPREALERLKYLLN